MVDAQMTPDQSQEARRFLSAPATKLGWTATGLAVVAIALMLVSGMAAAVLGIVAGIVAVIALVRGERSMLVWFGVLAGLFFLASIASALFMG